jgi:TetR/AcrR family transcriptional repressor of nem operon
LNGHNTLQRDAVRVTCGGVNLGGTRLRERVDTTIGAQATSNPLAAVMQAYLSQQHRDNPGAGCVIASLGAETSRQGNSLRRAVTDGTRAMLDLFTSLAPGRTRATKRERAMVAYASMVGALVLARAVDDATLSDEILQAVTAALPGAGSS